MSTHEVIDAIEYWSPLLYGVSAEEDDFICELHGCRLSSINSGLCCSECLADKFEIEQEEERICGELYYAEMVESELDHGKCTFIRGPGFTAFQCTMPWWA